MELLSNRLKLRPVTPQDIEHYVALFADRGFPAHIGGAKTRVELAEKNKKDAATWGEYGYGRFVMHLRHSDEAIGVCGVWQMTAEDLNFNEIGYGLFERHWQQGYSTEALGLIIDFARLQLRLESIGARVAPANTASKNVLLKAGFQFVQALEQGKTEYWQMKL